MGSKCRTTSSFVIIKQSVKLVRKCSVYLVNWVIRRCHSAWMTGHKRIAKDGYFPVPVITIGNAEPKKFMVELAYLSYPPSIGVLEAAEKEFRFEQQAVLVIPCAATALQNILLHV